MTGVLNAAGRLRPSAVGETKVGHRQSTSKGRDVLTGKRLSSVLLAIIFIILSSLAASAGTIAYKVKKGDTLWAIANKYHTTPKQIAKANGISENATLALGKSLRIPSKYSAAKPRTTVKQSQDVGYAVYTKADNVCLRKGPGTDSAKISVLLPVQRAKYSRLREHGPKLPYRMELVDMYTGRSWQKDSLQIPSQSKWHAQHHRQTTI